MSEENHDSFQAHDDAPYGENAASYPAVGEQLRSEREARGLSIEDVSISLKLSLRQVEALEAGDWSSLPGSTIIRGFVRNYARLLRLDPEALMAQLDAAQLPQRAHLDISAGTSATLPQPGRPARRDMATVISGLVLVLLAVLVYFFVPENFWQAPLAPLASPAAVPPAPPAGEAPADTSATGTAPAEVAAVAVAPGAAGAAGLPPSATQPTNGAPAVPETPPAAAAPAAPAPSQPAAPAALAPGEGARSGTAIQLEFSKPSWVEIRDGSGRVLLSQLNQPGSREVQGQPPFSLVIGNASFVSLRYKGEAVALGQRSKEDVARLTLE